MSFLRLLVDFRTPALDILFQCLTFIAQEPVVILVICWLYWCHDKILAYTLAFTYFLSGLLIQGLKLVFRIPRPWILDPDFQPVASALSGATGFSFPSGHTQSATALFSTLGFAAKKLWQKAGAFFLIALIGFSRMYLGVHTPKDVLTACLLTLILSLFVTYVLRDSFYQPEHAAHFAIFLTVLCTILTVYSTYFYFTYPQHHKMAQDSLKACGAGFGFALGFYLERTRISFSLPASSRGKVIRFLAGAAGVLILRFIFKATIQRILFGRILSYFFLILWIMAIYPYLFQKRHS